MACGEIRPKSVRFSGECKEHDGSSSEDDRIALRGDTLLKELSDIVLESNREGSRKETAKIRSKHHMRLVVIEDTLFDERHSVRHDAVNIRRINQLYLSLARVTGKKAVAKDSFGLKTIERDELTRNLSQQYLYLHGVHTHLKRLLSKLDEPTDWKIRAALLDTTVTIVHEQFLKHRSDSAHCMHPYFTEMLSLLNTVENAMERKDVREYGSIKDVGNRRAREIHKEYRNHYTPLLRSLMFKHLDGDFGRVAIRLQMFHTKKCIESLKRLEHSSFSASICRTLHERNISLLREHDFIRS